MGVEEAGRRNSPLNGSTRIFTDERSLNCQRTAGDDERGHADPLGHRAGRPEGGRAAPAAGLRRAAPPGQQRLAQEKPGQTLQATALVHEAYLRLVTARRPSAGTAAGHFFAAAAEAMRRILVDSARRKRRLKARRRPAAGRPGRTSRSPTPRARGPPRPRRGPRPARPRGARPAELVKLRYFAGLTQDEAAEALGVLGGPPTATGLTPGPGSPTSSARARGRRR